MCVYRIKVVMFLPYVFRNLASLQNSIFQEPNTPASENISSAPHDQIQREGIDSI